MSACLLALSIGPVQGFISAARRTRDLWFGSYVLSEISKSAARALQDRDAELIFPAPDSADALRRESELSVANKILAELPAELDPQALVGAARTAARERWREFAQEARQCAHRRVQGAVRDDIWEGQVDDIVEFYAAWTPLQGGYKEARTRVERLLAGRKLVRVFSPGRGRAMVPKSSLDGARESVLGQELTEAEGLCLRLKGQEQLDVVGLTKRLAGDPEQQFVSVSRIAADPWVRGLVNNAAAREKLRQIARCCHADFAARITDPNFAAFDREGTVLYVSRIQALLKDKVMGAHREALEQIRSHLGQIAAFGLRGPSPYLAILKADGDRMGKAIAAIENAEEHRRFSRRLSCFAGAAREIIKEHRGYLVYSGGDDVLGFLSLDTCLQAARQLHDRFGELMEEFGRDAEGLTLSVGIAIGHYLEPLEDLLDRGRAAERAAKKESRDGLAVHLATRGGEVIKVRRRWKEQPDQRLITWTELLLKDELPDKVAYDLKQLARDYRGWTEEELSRAKGLLKKDTRRLLGKKRSRGSELPQERIGGLLKFACTPAALEELATELLIARHLAEARAQAGGLKEYQEGRR